MVSGHSSFCWSNCCYFFQDVAYLDMTLIMPLGNFLFLKKLAFLKELRNCILCIIRAWSLFCSIWIYVSGHVQKKVALRDIEKIEKSEIFVLFEKKPYMKVFLLTSVSSCGTDTFVTFSVKI